MKIKVCGITQAAQLQALQQMGVDYAGLIFYPGSKRFVGAQLVPSDVQQTAIKKVGVFVNAEYATIQQAIRDYGLYAVQLHGDETDEFCLELTGQAKVIKAIRVGDKEELGAMVSAFERACDYFLFDTHTTQYGGSGQQFDWAVLEKAAIPKPFFLSGGIGPGDVAKLKAFHHPNWYAVDVNSRFEQAPGVKDLHLVQEFVTQFRGRKD